VSFLSLECKKSPFFLTDANIELLCPTQKKDRQKVKKKEKANCIRLLLDQGADINGNSKSAHGTPLQCAKINNHTGCVELLLRNGANDVVEDSDNVQKAGIGEVIMNTVASDFFSSSFFPWVPRKYLKSHVMDELDRSEKKF